MSAYAKLSRRRQIFVDLYVELGVGVDVIRKLQPHLKRPTVRASQLLMEPEVRAAVQERKDEAIARAGARHLKLVERICDMAYANVGQLRDENGLPIPFAKLPDSFLRGIESIEFDDKGGIKKVKLAAVAGSRMLGDILKAFPQVHEHTGKDGGPIETREVSALEKARRIAFLLAQGLRAAPTSTVLSDDAEASSHPNSGEGSSDD